MRLCEQVETVDVEQMEVRAEATAALPAVALPPGP
jgi:hypothetical protein